jgi:hypothetical protein
MKNKYVVYIIEPDKDFIMTKNWKQSCNFVIEIIKIKENEQEKKDKSVFYYGS